MFSILNKLNPFKGSQPEDKQVIEKDYAEVYEEIHDGEGFTGINNSTNIPEIDYVISMSEAIYGTVRKSALLGGKYTGEYLPWALKATSNAMDYIATASTAANMANYVRPNSVTVLKKVVYEAVGYKPKLIKNVCDIANDFLGPFLKETSVSCSHKIIEDAIRDQGERVYGVSSEEYDDKFEEITSKEIDEACEPNTNMENINFTKRSSLSL